MVREVLGIVFGIRCRLDQQKTGCNFFQSAGLWQFRNESGRKFMRLFEKTAAGRVDFWLG